VQKFIIFGMLISVINIIYSCWTLNAVNKLNEYKTILATAVYNLHI